MFQSLLLLTKPPAAMHICRVKLNYQQSMKRAIKASTMDGAQGWLLLGDLEVTLTLLCPSALKALNLCVFGSEGWQETDREHEYEVDSSKFWGSNMKGDRKKQGRRKESPQTGGSEKVSERKRNFGGWYDFS